MTPRQIQTVRSTFGRVYRTPEAAGLLFYGKLFALAPAVRPLFPADLSAQAKKLMETLSVAVATLRNPDSLAPMLERLGRSHAAYATSAHYDAVGTALLATLAEALGPDWTDEAADAWTILYASVSEAMQRAAADMPARAA